MNEETPSFGVRLEAARKAAGMTQDDLGRGLGPKGRDLGKAAVSAWENGKSAPNVDQLNLICQRLNISADALVLTQAPRRRRSHPAQLAAA